MHNYEQEIHDLHQFFQEYMKGTIAATDIARFDNTMDTHFTIISSDGQVVDRAGIIDYVRNGHGRRRNFKIWTQNVTLRQQIGDTLIITYEEWQTIDDATTARTSTVVFQQDETMPNGLRWLHVHESGLKTVTGHD